MFDLDGTLVQTEKLKARSYAIVVQHLLKLPQPDARAVKAYQQIVGATQDMASKHITATLGLEDKLRPLMGEYKVSQPYLVLKSMRQAVYAAMVADPGVIRRNKWPYTIELLRLVKENSCLTALVTNSLPKDALHVLHSLGIENLLDLIITGADVKQGKPSPMSYRRAIKELRVPAEECLALEDSVSGVRAAAAAGVNVIAIATPFTNAGLHQSEVVNHAWIVHHPAELVAEVMRRIAEHNRMLHGNQSEPSPNLARKRSGI